MCKCSLTGEPCCYGGVRGEDVSTGKACACNRWGDNVQTGDVSAFATEGHGKCKIHGPRPLYI